MANRKVKEGDKVKVQYKGTLEDGTVFDSADDSNPFEFTIGEKMVLPTFERVVMGLEVGSETQVSIPSEEAYGEPNPEMISLLERSQMPDGVEPEVGMTLQANADEKTVIHVVVTAINDDTITVDANHPLVGKELTFDIKLVEIVSQGATD